MSRWEIKDANTLFYSTPTEPSVTEAANYLPKCMLLLEWELVAST